MTKLYIAIDKALMVISQHRNEWKVDTHLVNSQPLCVAVDPQHSEQVYCGTFALVCVQE